MIVLQPYNKTMANKTPKTKIIYCNCKFKTIDDEDIICLERNKAYCEKCEKPIHHQKIIKLVRQNG